MIWLCFRAPKPIYVSRFYVNVLKINEKFQTNQILSRKLQTLENIIIPADCCNNSL